jgi:hypothetical protein
VMPWSVATTFALVVLFALLVSRCQRGESLGICRVMSVSYLFSFLSRELFYRIALICVCETWRPRHMV